MSSKKKFLFLLMFFIIGQTVFAGIDHRIAKIIVNEHQHRPIEGTIVLIGRQSIWMTLDEAIVFLKGEGLEIRKDAIIETDQTTYGAQKGSWITDRSFFSLFSSAKILALDVSEYEGAEIIADLNQPLEDKHHNIADFIYNGSCLDNLFDPASALSNHYGLQIHSL